EGAAHRTGTRSHGHRCLLGRSSRERGHPTNAKIRFNLAQTRGRLRMSNYRIVERLARDPDAERRALVAGLVASPAVIAPKYFYDALGCALFGAICELPEYYPTRTERAIFSEHRDAIARAVGRGKQFVDLGAGDCCKALGWLPFLEPARYLAVDFARDEIA